MFEVKLIYFSFVSLGFPLAFFVVPFKTEAKGNGCHFFERQKGFSRRALYISTKVCDVGTQTQWSV
jgi:hypothetical protein